MRGSLRCNPYSQISGKWMAYYVLIRHQLLDNEVGDLLAMITVITAEVFPQISKANNI